MCLEEIKLLLLVVVLVTLLLDSRSNARDVEVEVVPFIDPLPALLKTYVLYSWQAGREWYFTLMTGDYRGQTYQKITSGENMVEEDWVKITVQSTYGLEAALDQLPHGCNVMWAGPKLLKQAGIRPVDLALPPRKTIQRIEGYCAQLGIQLRVSC